MSQGARGRWFLEAADDELTIFERSRPGRRSFVAPAADVPDRPLDELLPAQLRRAQAPRLPEVSEPELVRHFNRLSKRNFDLDTGFYPLGSCTMKHNPKLHERVAALDGHARLHPLQDPSRAQGALELMWRLQQNLAEIAGLPYVSLQPSAGSHGELAGVLLTRAYHEDRGEGEQQAGQHHRGPEHGGHHMAQASELPWREQSRGAVQEADVPVRLRGRAHRGRIVGAVQPHRVDLGQPAQGRDHAGDEHQQADALGRVRRPEAGADDIVLAGAPTSELGVLLAPDDGQVGAKQPGDQAGQEQREPRGERAGLGEAGRGRNSVNPEG